MHDRNNSSLGLPCNPSNNTAPPPPFEQPLKVNGGFIAMAAGLSVVVPLICVLIIQLRRAKVEERNRRIREESGATSTDEAPEGVCDPPPSYQQLFGENYTATLNPSRRNALDVLTEENEAEENDSEVQRSRSRRLSSGTNDGGRGNGATSGGSPVHVSLAVGSGPHENLGFSSTSVATISGSEVTDGHLQHPDPSLSESEGYISASEEIPDTRRSSSATSASSSSSSRSMGSSRRASSQSSQSQSSTNTTGIESCTGQSPSSLPDPNEPDNSEESSSSSSSTRAESQSPTYSLSPSPTHSIVSSSSSQEPLMVQYQTSNSSFRPSPPPSSPPASVHIDETPPPPPPPMPLTPPPPFSASRNETSGNFRFHAIQRRYPGMHLSVQDFINTFKRIPHQETDASNEGPPPSYDEALKILELAKEKESEAHK